MHYVVFLLLTVTVVVVNSVASISATPGNPMVGRKLPYVRVVDCEKVDLSSKAILRYSASCMGDCNKSKCQVVKFYFSFGIREDLCPGDISTCKCSNVFSSLDKSSKLQKISDTVSDLLSCPRININLSGRSKSVSHRKLPNYSSIEKIKHNLDELFSPLPDISISDEENQIQEQINPKEQIVKKKKASKQKSTKIKKQQKISEKNISKAFQKLEKRHKKKKNEPKKKFIPTTPICKFYQEGRCTNDECPFRHEGPLIQKKEICKFYLAGVCQKEEDCIYSHDTQNYPCRFFYLGNCRQNNCKFSHQGEITEEQRIELKKIWSAGMDEEIKEIKEKKQPEELNLENPFAKKIF
eukprot:gene4963-8557_t